MITITTQAANKFKELVTDNILLPRIKITAGGCNGFEKQFSLDNINDDDISIDLHNGVTILVDEYSFTMLDNSTVDYKTTLTGSFFTIAIPDALSSCGCGASFSL